MKTVKFQDDKSGGLFDHLRKVHGLTADCKLSPLVGLDAPSISQIRHGKRRLSAGNILHTHKATGMPVAEIEALLPAPVKRAKKAA